jgi:hypothetical protein
MIVMVSSIIQHNKTINSSFSTLTFVSASLCFMPFPSLILPDKYSGTPISPDVQPTSCEIPCLLIRQILCLGDRELSLSNFILMCTHTY